MLKFVRNFVSVIKERFGRTGFFRFINLLLLAAGLISLFVLYKESQRYFEKGSFYITPVLFGSVDGFTRSDIEVLDRKFIDGKYSYEKQQVLELRSEMVKVRAMVAFTNRDYHKMNFFRYADGSFFDRELAAEKQAVISESLAHKLYGDSNAAGLSIYYKYDKYTVSGVVAQDEISENGYYVWLPMHHYEDNFEVECLYLKPYPYDRIDGYKRAEELLTLMGKNVLDYKIIDLTAYSESINMRLEFVLSVLIIYISVLLLITAYRLYRKWKAVRKKIYLIIPIILAVIAVILTRGINFNYNTPLLSGGPFEQIFKAITNYGLLPEKSYLSYNMTELANISSIANIVFIMCFVCIINFILITKTDFVLRPFFKRFAPVFAAAFVMMAATACSAASEDDSSMQELEIPRGKVSGTLSITEYTGGRLGSIMSDFIYFNPEADIVNEVISVEELPIKLMSGTCSDIFEVGVRSTKNGVSSQIFPYFQYADLGLLENLKPYMEKDTQFRITDYNTNLFDALEYNGELNVFPESYDYNMVVINKNAPQSVRDKFYAMEKISYAQMIELYEESELSGEMFMAENYRTPIAVNVEISDYIDFDNKKCHFESEEFIDLLISYASVMEKNKVGQNQNIMASDAYKDDTYLEDAYLFRIVDKRPLQYLLDFEPNKFEYPIPLTDSNGDISAEIYSMYAINKNSKNKTLAWKYLAFAYSKRYSGYFPDGGVPIELSKYSSSVKLQMWDYEQSVKNTYGIRMKSANAFKLIMDRLDEMIAHTEQKVNSNNMQFFNSVVADEVDKLLKGQLSPEMAAANIQNKVTLMLLE